VFSIKVASVTGSFKSGS